MDTINANLTPFTKFITLTCKDDCLDREDFLRSFDIFKKQFKRLYGYTFPAVSLLERQKKRGKKFGNLGAWHMHCVVFIRDFIEPVLFGRCWTRGQFHIEVCSSGDVGVYLMKYLSKDNDDLDLNKKVLFKSGNLREPTRLTSMTVCDTSIYDYTSSWTFYQGNLTADLENGCFDPEKVNACVLKEIHHYKHEKGAIPSATDGVA